MVLYSADIMDMAVPVKSVKRGKKTQESTPDPEEPVVKKSRKRKAIVVQLPDQKEPEKIKKSRAKKVVEPVEKVEAVVEDVEKVEEPRAKKRLSEKQMVAIEKRKLANSLKKKIAEQEKTNPVEEVKEEIASTPIEPKPKRIRVKKDPNVAPAWFEKFVENIQKEKNQFTETKVTAKQVKADAIEVAKKRWEDGLVRDRVNDEMNNHMGRMYKMIFSGRQ